MKQVFSGRTALEAHEVRLLLESRGIAAFVDGESSAFPNLSFTPTSEPSVFVNETDCEQARALIERFSRRDRRPTAGRSWKCASCGEKCGSEFDGCWNCGDLRAQEPTEIAGPSESTVTSEISNATSDLASTPALQSDKVFSPVVYPWRQWFEVIIVLSTFYGTYYLFWEMVPSWRDEATFATVSFVSLFCDAFVVALTVGIIYLSHQPWSHFGLVRPKWLYDILSGAFLCFITYWISTIAYHLLMDLLNTYLFRYEVYRLLQDHNEYLIPQGAVGLLAALALSASVGFTEELVMRGYLIPRLECLLCSTTASVLTGTLLFAAMHWSQGVIGVWCALWTGLFYGIVFTLYRRLWPLVIAHSAWDFSAFLQGGVLF